MTSREMNRLTLTSVLLFVCLSLCPSVQPAEAEGLAADVKVLKNAGIAADEAALLAFLKKQTVSEDQRRTIAELIKQLGDDTFLVREKAYSELKALGPAARTALQKALNHEDLEIATRAKRLLKDVENGSHGDLLTCAARVLAVRKSAKAVEVLLAFLPDAAGFGIEEDVIQGVAALAVSEGKAHPAIVRALGDRLPLLRAAAGEALARAALPKHVEAVRRLLKDIAPTVRLRVSLILVCSGDRTAMPVLLGCLPQFTRDQVWQVEDILYRLGGSKVPQLPPGNDAPARKKYHDECLAWWKEHGPNADMTRLEGGPLRKARMRARASNFFAAHQSPDKAIDGDRGTIWNAGNPPPAGGAGQWIEVDVGAVRQLGGLLMVTSMLPDGPTTHEVWVSTEPIGTDRTRARLVHTFKGQTKTSDILRFDFPKRLSGRFVQIRTTESPSWVAWAEIELGVR